MTTPVREKILKEQTTFLEQQKSLEKNLVNTKKLIHDEFGNMKDYNTLEKYREHIKTRFFWADTWAISTLEVLLNIKIIILSEQAYKEKAYDNVLDCGERSRLIPDNTNEPIVGNDGVQYSPFHPKLYVMTTHTLDHYRLVTYKNRQMFHFSEIPYDVRILIVNKCLEKNSGVFHIIPEFRNFKDSLTANGELEIIENDNHLTQEEEEDNIDPCERENGIVFLYHNTSLDAKIGKGKGEKIDPADIPKYTVLNSMTEWRKKLDDSWVAPFSIDNLRWNTVEHYTQAAKFKKGFPDFYKSFSLDADTDLSKDPKLAKVVGTTKSKRPKEVKIDPDYELGRNTQERQDAVYAKFSQNEDLKQILMATKGACIKRFIRSNPPEVDSEIQAVRDKLIYR
jgi:predicted NAD-dependent protein-ADP-ribosyltransferase YbiA (DUF1768 family)